MKDLITILIPTSPSQDNTISRLREYEELRECRVIVMDSTKSALELVQTPLILFCEQAPTGEIPFNEIANAIQNSSINYVRLENSEDTVEIEGVPLQRTIQWSQTYIANTDWYKDMLAGKDISGLAIYKINSK